MADTTGERTEQATEKRMREVRREGRLTTSRDMTGWISMAGAALVLPAVLGNGTTALTGLVLGLRAVILAPTAGGAERYLLAALGAVPPIVLPMLGASVAGAIVGVVAQGGVHVKAFKPSFKQFNLVTGAGRLVGKQALWEGAKALLKTGVVGVAVWLAIQGIMPLLGSSGAMPLTALVATASGVITAVLQSAIVAGIGLALVDLMVVVRRNRKHTRMTRQEVKDENKSTEGDPLVKSQRRSRALALTRNRMIAAVASADVVLLNPTHITVALKYEPGKSAPRVVAKGAGAVAAKIRERAADARVPMVHDIPLARALYAACDVGQEIPEELYAAVARVLAFVMSLKRRGAALGVHRMAS
ncbi:EscU/YscU/HrcU family type III secretion system export apparatus switch protein [Amnibacterium sp. CER49]|uniref:EscU/YscU/HrcU family type III secretion system export apparatus switch protein n=1 Tax=Amnibacterium sp. CER49 TaxID=3039161 RepID=UPI00244A4C79|nr:EscU/YscU/HrcU family type III secretion system export apparatus switch protein [Amnibacterium sp. CER49]MDH2443872.1 EscU/YscU/HrcU family type III secretion system export apparatus switch protein [Amnibacterium sp. CER49]